LLRTNLIMAPVLLGMLVIIPSILFSLDTAATAQTDRTYQSEEDGFRLQIPQGWVIDYNDIENPLDSNNNIIAMICPENEALPGIGGESNCQAANLTDAIFINRWSDLQSMPEFQNKSDDSSCSGVVPPASASSVHRFC
jgi:hypothetical protein